MIWAREYLLFKCILRKKNEYDIRQYFRSSLYEIVIQSRDVEQTPKKQKILEDIPNERRMSISQGTLIILQEKCLKASIKFHRFVINCMQKFVAWSEATIVLVLPRRNGNKGIISLYWEISPTNNLFHAEIKH